MKVLGEAASRLMAGLCGAGNEAGQILSELDALDTRLHRAFTAVSIDNWIANLNVERNRMLEDEKQAKRTAGLMKLPSLGIYGLVALSGGRRPDWSTAAGEVFRERPYEDVRVAVSSEGIRLVNVSEVARSRGMTVSEVVDHMEGRGYEVLSWQEFEDEADNLRWAALKGEGKHLEIEKAAL